MHWFWLAARVYVGWIWLSSGWGKVTNSSWVGEGAGAALSKFVRGALENAPGGYAAFLESAVLPHAQAWSYTVAFGELLVGAALIVGLATGLAAAFGAFMNVNFLLAGAMGSNPILLALSVLLIFAWKTAGLIGLDRFVLPKLINLKKT